MIHKLEEPYYNRPLHGEPIYHPTHKEIVNKINEIIEYLNHQESLNIKEQ